MASISDDLLALGDFYWQRASVSVDPCKLNLFCHLFCFSFKILYIIISVFRSTDSQLKLWTLTTPQCARTFKGHINEKNFVGLATDGDYVACGQYLKNDPYW